MPKPGFGAVLWTKRPREARSPEAGRARGLRAGQTLAERILWDKLRDRRFLGLKFRRQFPFASFIADFYCEEVKLVVEVDGSVHEDPQQKASDENRDIVLRQLGIKVLRVTNTEVGQTMDAVLQKIAAAATLHYQL
jgi:very-short-patch-repair endonuclease